MAFVFNPDEIKNQRIGRTISIVLHVVLLLILFLSFLPYQVPPPGQSGVLVSFGEPNQGRNDQRAAPAPVVEEEE
ncbi:MAG: hypothetical protein HKN16_09965, partial [Saprospiraceae bacterium]|nr:hypothetical protein [Saprospiraceae bacterium]